MIFVLVSVENGCVILNHKLVCSSISVLIIAVVINNDPKLPVLTLTLYFKMQVAHFCCSLGIY